METNKINIIDGQFTYIDLFCGAGGFSLGFKQAGFKHLFGIDNWNKAIETYNKNIGQGRLIDIKNYTKQEYRYDERDYKRIDVVIGSPPCQSFSVQNSKKHLRTCDMTLTNEFFRIVDIIKPRIWILENVPQIAKFIKRGNIYIFNAKNFGCPQARKRCFVSNINLNPEKEQFKTVKEVINNCPNVEDWGITERFKKWLIENPGLNGRPQKWSSANFRINPDEPSPTILGSIGRNMGWFHYKYNRRLNISEYKRLQTFPDNFQFSGNKRDIGLQIGNSVMPDMAYKLALCVKKYLTENGIPPKPKDLGILPTII